MGAPKADGHAGPSLRFVVFQWETDIKPGATRRAVSVGGFRLTPPTGRVLNALMEVKQRWIQ
jgi:hypothetical protein